MSFNIFNPPAIVAPAPSRRAIAQYQEQIEFEDKLRRHLFYGSIKLRGEDGRTYNYIDKNGEYISSFLSPYNSKILDNVEPQIKPVISTLISKGYLPAGSCQGHPKQGIFTRWVTLAFVSDEERKKFIDKVNSYNLPVYWYFNFLDFEEAPKLPEKREGATISINMRDQKYNTIEEQRSSKYSKKDLTDFWNIMFARKYEEYFPVKMFICSCPGDVTLYNRFKMALQWPFRDYYTKKLVDKMQDLDTYNW